MNETKLLKQIEDKFMNFNQKIVSMHYYTDEKLQKDFNRNIKFKNSLIYSVKNQILVKNESKYKSATKSKTPIKSIKQQKIPHLNIDSTIGNSFLNFDLNFITDDIKIERRNLLKLSNATANLNKHKNNKNVIAGINLNKQNTSNNNINTFSSSDNIFIINETTNFQSKSCILDRIIVRAFKDLDKLNEVTYYSNINTINLSDTSNKSENIFFINFSNLDQINLKFESEKLNKLFLKNDNENINVSYSNNNNFDKSSLNFIGIDEYQYEKYILNNFTLVKLLKFEEKVHKFNKFYKRNINDNLSKERSIKEMSDNFNFLTINRNNKRNSVLNFDLTTVYENKIDLQISLYNEKLNKMSKILNYNDENIFKINNNSTINRLDLIYEETSKTIFDYDFKKININYKIKNISKISNINNICKNSSFNSSLLNFLTIPELKNKLEKINNEKEINTNSNVTLKIIQSSKKRKFSEINNKSHKKNENNSKSISDRKSLILLNLPNLNKILLQNQIRELNTELKKMNLIFNFIEDKQTSKEFINMDIIVNANTGIILINPEEFADELDSNSFDNLSEIINNNYLSYDNITIAIIKRNSNSAIKIIETLRKYFNKKFGNIYLNFNLNLQFVIIENINDIIEVIIELDKNNSDKFITENFKIIINKKFLNISQNFKFLNLIEVVLLERNKEYFINFVIQKYKKKNINIDYNLLNSIISK